MPGGRPSISDLVSLYAAEGLAWPAGAADGASVVAFLAYLGSGVLGILGIAALGLVVLTLFDLLVDALVAWYYRTFYGEDTNE